MNVLTLVGRVGKDPEIKTYGDDKQIAKFSLATDDGYGDNKKTNWHNCVVFGKRADVISQYVHKSDRLAVVGSVEYREHDGKWYTSVIVTDFDLLGHRSTTTDDTKPKSDDLPF